MRIKEYETNSNGDKLEYFIDAMKFDNIDKDDNGIINASTLRVNQISLKIIDPRNDQLVYNPEYKVFPDHVEIISSRYNKSWEGYCMIHRRRVYNPVTLPTDSMVFDLLKEVVSSSNNPDLNP